MDIREFYKGKNILITGGTGYVGKAVAEKLLRSCDVGKIFLLIRTKPKTTVSQRLDRIKANVVFDVIKEEKPKEIDKVFAIAGDLTQDELGLSSDDKKQLTDEIHVILHSAASVEMVADMKVVVNANLCGTRRLLNLGFKNIQVFVFVSTSFLHPKTKGKKKEVTVPIIYPEDELIMTMNRLNFNERKRITPLLLGSFRNWYAASKAYAEVAVRETKGFPCAIVRPSSISSAWKEPFPGFNDSHNSYPSIVRSAYIGVIRRSIVESAIDLVPIDLVVNAIIAAGWKAALEKSDETVIYHAVSGPFVQKHSYSKPVNSFIHDYPSKYAVWYPNLRFSKRFDFLRVGLFFYQFLPGLFFDLVLYIAGKRTVFVSSYKKFADLIAFAEEFSTRDYNFSVDNLLALHKELSEEERVLPVISIMQTKSCYCDILNWCFSIVVAHAQLVFYLNIQDINWEKYYRDMTSGVRRCLLKENHEDLKEARRKNQILRVLNFLVECAFHGLLWWLASIGSGFPLSWLVWVPVLSYCIFTFVL